MEGVGKGMKTGELGGDGGAGKRGVATLGEFMESVTLRGALASLGAG